MRLEYETNPHQETRYKGEISKLRHLKRKISKNIGIKRNFEEKQFWKREETVLLQKKVQPVYKIMNRFSLLLHVLYACLINLVIESISRHSFLPHGLYGRFALDIFV